MGFLAWPPRALAPDSVTVGCARFAKLSMPMIGRLTHRGRAAAPLLVRARDEPELFADFYEEMYEQSLRYFARRLFDPEAAFDLTAETFASAFDSLADFRGSTADEGYAWFWAIARHQLSHYWRRGKVERSALDRLGVDPLPLSDIEFERAEELADLSEHRSGIAAALGELPDEQRDAIRLRIVEELSYADVADQMGASQQVVRARVSRGLRQLGRILEANRPAEGGPSS